MSFLFLALVAIMSEEQNHFSNFDKLHQGIIRMKLF